MHIHTYLSIYLSIYLSLSLSIYIYIYIYQGPWGRLGEAADEGARAPAAPGPDIFG